jgi:hypothetical protein
MGHDQDSRQQRNEQMWLTANDSIEYLLMRYGAARARRSMSLLPTPTKGPNGQPGYETSKLIEAAQKAGTMREDKGIPAKESGPIIEPPPDAQALLRAACDWANVDTPGQRPSRHRRR